MHYITSLLHPSFKNFRGNPQLKTTAIDLVNNEILKRHSLSTNNGSSTNIASLDSTTALDTQSTYSNSLLSKCFDLSTTNQQSSSTPCNELDEYQDWNRTGKPVPDRPVCRLPVRSGCTFKTGRFSPVFTGFFINFWALKLVYFACFYQNPRL